jgi:hypothetical protein
MLEWGREDLVLLGLWRKGLVIWDGWSPCYVGMEEGGLVTLGRGRGLVRLGWRREA